MIRWEMLPIAWPIQIHGIVLSVSDATVVLVDFGLTAAPQDNMNATSPKSSSAQLDDDATTTTAATTTTTSTTQEQEEVDPSRKKPSIFSSDPKEMDAARKELLEKSAASSKKILKSFQKLHPQTNKKRLNVIILEDPAEWKKWKKVNYETGFFGFGKNNNNNTGPTSDDGRDSIQEETSKDDGSTTNWWNKMKFGRTTKKPSSSSNLSQHSDDTATESKSETSAWFRRPMTTSTSTSNLPHSDSGVSIASSTANEDVYSNKAKQWWNKVTNPSTQEATDTTSSSVSPTVNGAGEHEEPSSATNVEEINQAPPKLEMEMEDEEEIESETQNKKVPQLELEPEESHTLATDSEQDEKKSPTAFMNPAMARLMESKKEEQKQGSSRKGLFGGTPFFGKSKTKDTTAETQQDGKAKKKLDLPKADPPKLVLARTRWLLHHGEAVLPPYHAFHSNSECIAVFCKTGYWSNLQADVFLHSTAIGNAKTMGAATLGVAASAPFLAPVIAGLGIGMVAAPWLILHSSKQQSDDITLRMTDQFWAQAEPEVFVECIEHWSKLEEYYQRLEESQQQQLDTPRIVTL